MKNQNFIASLIAIVALAVTSGCASVKPLYIDMSSGDNYPEKELNLSSIAEVKYTPITNTDRF